MGDELATANVNRSYQLAGTGIAIFTFTLGFLYPRFVSGDIDGTLFEAALVVLGVATFAYLLAAFHYYGSSIGRRISDAERAVLSRRGDWLWLIGMTLVFLDPSLILVAARLVVVGAAWFAFWLVYVLFAIRFFPRVKTSSKDAR